jgi:spore coat polysaccharide biosynthesis protein SpsF
MQRPVVAITQARIGSTRLPGKVLAPILGKPLLWWHLTRLQRAREIDRVVVATTDEPEADQIVAIAASVGAAVWRGPLDDVLRRYAGAAEAFGASTIVRVTSDCPLIDPDLVDRLIVAYEGRPEGVDYMSLDVARLPRGLDAEIFARARLDDADREAIDPAEREHVTAFLYRRPQRFGIAAVAPDAPLRPGMRLCVDTAADLDLVTRIVTTLAPRWPTFTWHDIAALLDAHPDWWNINAAVVQKTV